MKDLFQFNALELMLADVISPYLEHSLIRPVGSLQEIRDVFHLTYDYYVESGYCALRPSGMFFHFGEFDPQPETTILVALSGGKVIGSISLTVDGPMGLPADTDFKAECDQIRQQGEKLGVVWRLVVEKSLQTPHMALELMREIIKILLKQGVTRALMMVNPHHASAYKWMLHAEIIGKKADTTGLNEAPMVLLCFKPADLPKDSPLQSKQKHTPRSDIAYLINLNKSHSTQD